MAFADVQDDEAPLLLLLAGSDNRASQRWLTQWEKGFAFTRRVSLGSWDDPQPSAWLDTLNRSVLDAARPVVLVTHGHSCLAVAWWVEYQRLESVESVRAAILQDPPVLVPSAAGALLARIGPYPQITMPFPTCLLASPNRGFGELSSLRRLARQWDCYFDTMAEHSVPKPRSFKSVQSLGERFLAQVTQAKFAMRPATAQAGYPFSPRER